MKPYEGTRMMALDVRHSRIGYAVFSGPKLLLDWGIIAVPAQGDRRTEQIVQRMIGLLRQCSPASIVVKQPRKLKLNGKSTGEPILATVLSVASEHSALVRFLGGDEIQAAFRVFRTRTKDDIACVMVQIFPELLVCLPPKRKTWQSEPHRMIIFDAVATGFAYWQRPLPHQ
jgi:hypothetical protein